MIKGLIVLATPTDTCACVNYRACVVDLHRENSNERRKRGVKIGFGGDLKENKALVGSILITKTLEVLFPLDVRARVVAGEAKKPRSWRWTRLPFLHWTSETSTFVSRHDTSRAALDSSLLPPPTLY